MWECRLFLLDTRWLPQTPNQGVEQSDLWLKKKGKERKTRATIWETATQRRTLIVVWLHAEWRVTVVVKCETKCTQRLVRRRGLGWGGGGAMPCLHDSNDAKMNLWNVKEISALTRDSGTSRILRPDVVWLAGSWISGGFRQCPAGWWMSPGRSCRSLTMKISEESSSSRQVRAHKMKRRVEVSATNRAKR